MLIQIYIQKLLVTHCSYVLSLLNFEPKMLNFHFFVFVLMWECHVLYFKPSMTPGLLIVTEGFF